MTENVDSLVLEQVRLIRSDLGKLNEAMRGSTVEMVAMRHHQRGVELSRDAHHDDIVVAIKTRLDKIETRLQLVD